MSNRGGRQAPPPNAGSNLVKAVADAARKKATPYAQLGTVVQGMPTLTVELDTGQVIPQCAGPDGLTPGMRVLGWYINDGHDLAVLPFSAPSPT